MELTPVELEYLKIFVSALTPIFIFIFGFFLLRRSEGIKTKAARQSGYAIKHSEYFFETYQKFLEALERILAAAILLSRLPEKNSSLAANLAKEIERLYPDVSELELRIQRCIAFAPTKGEKVTKIARECCDLIGSLMSKRAGPVAPLTVKIISLDAAAREAHEEMLERAPTSLWQKVFH